MKRARLALIAVFLVLGAPACFATEPLVTIESRGGLCPSGTCGSTTALSKEGFVFSNNKLSGWVWPVDLARLRAAIDAADFPALRKVKFTGTCPTAYDGNENIYTFHTAHGAETIASCKTKIDHDSPPFSLLRSALK